MITGFTEILLDNNVTLLIDADGQLRGANNVMVGSEFFNVTFLDGRCDMLTEFNGCNDASDFTFADFDSATLAANALLESVFIDDLVLSIFFDSLPNLTFGCDSSVSCRTLVPYQLTSRSSGDFQVRPRVSLNFALDQPDFLGGSPLISSRDDLTLFDINNFAAFAPVPVPEPSTVAILALGLFGIGMRRQLGK